MDQRPPSGNPCSSKYHYWGSRRVAGRAGASSTGFAWELVRNVEPRAPPQTHWIRHCILRSPGDSQTHWVLRSIAVGLKDLICQHSVWQCSIEFCCLYPILFPTIMGNLEISGKIKHSDATESTREGLTLEGPGMGLCQQGRQFLDNYAPFLCLNVYLQVYFYPLNCWAVVRIWLCHVLWH